jgi:hypothetical protein
MYKFIIKFDGIFNKILIASVLIFIGFVLGGCSPRMHLQPDLSDSSPSNASYQYINMQKFKAQHGAFYSSLRK